MIVCFNATLFCSILYMNDLTDLRNGIILYNLRVLTLTCTDCTGERQLLSFVGWHGMWRIHLKPHHVSPKLVKKKQST